MIGHLRYLWALLRHKWYVFWACLDQGLPVWVGLIHDWPKFTHLEYMGYSRGFYTAWGRKTYNVVPMTQAWMHHQWTCGHHWQPWVMIDDLPIYMQNIMIWDKGNITLFGSFGSDEDTLMQVDLDPDSLKIKPFPMPDRYRREMLADWIGAGKAYGNPNTREWYLQRRDMFRRFIHPDTLLWLDIQLGVI